MLDVSYNIFRWYRASFGRYTQADPIGLEGGANLFSYTDGNPLTRSDVWGLAYKKCKLLEDKVIHQNVIEFDETKFLGFGPVYTNDKRKCKWRCYCWPDGYNCPKIPCKNKKCSLDHGVEEVRTYFNKYGVAPCKTFTAKVVEDGDCSDE